MTHHMHREMDSLKQQLLALSAEVERGMANAQTALLKLDIDIAKRTIAYDEVIDQRELDIEEECLKIMALYQPVASDLRLMVAILKMNNDLERMGDLCVNIAEYAIEITKRAQIEVPAKFQELFAVSRQMVRDALAAMIDGDLKLAYAVRERDDVVDRLNAEIIGEVCDMLDRDDRRRRALLFLISASRAVERIADYATNIAEDVIYAVDGTIVRHGQSRRVE